MEISQERIDELKEIMKKDYGVEYSDAEAREAAEPHFRNLQSILMSFSRK